MLCISQILETEVLSEAVCKNLNVMAVLRPVSYSLSKVIYIYAHHTDRGQPRSPKPGYQEIR